MELIIKLLYLVLGGMGGFYIARLLPSKLEARLTQSIMDGKKVVISIGETAYLYELIDGKIVIKTGTMEANYDAADENLGSSGPVQ